MDPDTVNQHLAVADADKLKQARGSLQKEKLKEACQGFEEILLKNMLKSMRSTVPENSLFGGGNSMDIYRSMHTEYLAEKISKGENSVGIKEYLYQELKDKIC